MRPTTLREIVGQARIKNQLQICIQAASIERRNLPHILFYGPPGLGKTTLAKACANELGVDLIEGNGANLRSIKNILPYLAKLTDKCVFFIDEVHRLTKLSSEFLYPAMEDGKVTLSNGKEVIDLDLPKFTLIGATTHPGLLPKPLQDRFIVQLELDKYSAADLLEIAANYATKLGLQFHPAAIQSLVDRCKHTPRILLNNLKLVRDLCLTKQTSCATLVEVQKTLDLLEIDERGLNSQDRRYLAFLVSQTEPVGLETIASALNIAVETIVNNVEPYLLQEQLILKTPKGRVINEGSKTMSVV
jgi:Holliday junction DNA helicase RuvB